MLNSAFSVREERVRSRLANSVERSINHALQDLDRGELEHRINKKIAERKLSSEILLSLFCCSCYHYRCTTVCEPFPPFFLDSEGEKDFSELRKCLDGMPSIQELSDSPAVLSGLSVKALTLLLWVIDPPFTLQNLSLQEFEDKTGFFSSCTNAAARPQYIFEIIHDQPTLSKASKGKTIEEENEVEENEEQKNKRKMSDTKKDARTAAHISANSKFLELSSKFSTTLGYHASSLENFYSIINKGLDTKFSKTVNLYGEGIYLSTDCGVCMSFITHGPNWVKSSLGSSVGAVVGCEVIQDPEFVHKGHTKEPGTKGMPGEYILSKSNFHVRVKYLLVLSDSKKRRVSRNTNKNTIIIIVFVLLLCFLAFLRSSLWRKWRFQYQL